MEQYAGILVGFFYAAMGAGVRELVLTCNPKKGFAFIIPFWPLILLYYALRFDRNS